MPSFIIVRYVWQILLGEGEEDFRVVAFWAHHPWAAPKMPIQKRVKVFYKENSSKINEIKDDLYSSFKENLTFGNNRYKTKLPFKKYNEILPDNFYLPKIQLNTLKTRLDKNENLMIEYDKIIK